ncbi:MAG: hypothetical protein NDI74_15335 [Sphingomonas sp.]|jgi:hypothetical protein|uniref:hypothetical protein n=1 Tax=Sphingomonas TaxID=13687 RepID=UPI0003AAC30F|nr:MULTISPECIES: hypothetical protein [Sphingomonas]MCM2300782.1 hypothetical protein [Sphingomonas sp.]
MTDTPSETPVFRSGPEELAYLRRRAEEHRQGAEKAADMGSRAIHLRLEQLYREQLGLLEIVLPD